MFTGIVESTGVVRYLSRRGEGLILQVDAPFCSELAKGESVAVNGVCLTVSEPDSKSFSADISGETTRMTTLSALRAGDKVNLERALRADSRLGGHIVQGHIDCVGKVLRASREGEFIRLEISFPRQFDKLIASKGSMAIDGVSLTVANKKSGVAEFALVPSTISSTTLSSLSVGKTINIEFDIIAKYLENMLKKYNGNWI